MTDNRSERLRRRRKQSTARADDQESTDGDQSSKPSKQDEPSERSGSTEDDEASSDADDISIKEEQIGTYMYLPESQTKELRRQYNILKAEYEFEYDEEFEKNRHFYPLVVQYGLESLEEMDASEIQTHLEGIVD